MNDSNQQPNHHQPQPLPKTPAQMYEMIKRLESFQDSREALPMDLYATLAGVCLGIRWSLAIPKNEVLVNALINRSQIQIDNNIPTKETKSYNEVSGMVADLVVAHAIRPMLTTSQYDTVAGIITGLLWVVGGNKEAETAIHRVRDTIQAKYETLN